MYSPGAVWEGAGGVHGGVEVPSTSPLLQLLHVPDVSFRPDTQPHGTPFVLFILEMVYFYFLSFRHDSN